MSLDDRDFQDVKMVSPQTRGPEHIRSIIERVMQQLFMRIKNVSRPGEIAPVEGKVSPELPSPSPRTFSGKDIASGPDS